MPSIAGSSVSEPSSEPSSTTMISNEYGDAASARSDAVDLLAEVPALVVDGQHDADVERLGVRGGRRRPRRGTIPTLIRSAGDGTRQRIHVRSDHTIVEPQLLGLFEGERRLVVGRAALLGEEVGDVADALDVGGLDRQPIGVERHRPRPEVGDHVVGAGVGRDGVEDGRDVGTRRTDLLAARPVEVPRVGDVAGQDHGVHGDQVHQRQDGEAWRPPPSPRRCAARARRRPTTATVAKYRTHGRIWK